MMMNGNLVDINYDHPLYTPTFEDPYWDNTEGLLNEEEEEFEEPKTPRNQGIVQWEECPSPIRKNNKRIIVSIGKNDRLMTNLYLPNTNTNTNTNNTSVNDLLKLIPQPADDAIQQRNIDAPVDDDAHDLENEDRNNVVLETDEVMMSLKGKLHRDLVQHERDWRQQLTWSEGEFRISVVRRHRDTKEWIIMEEKQRLRRVHEYSSDSVRDGKRRKLKLCADHPAYHPLTPYQNHHA